MKNKLNGLSLKLTKYMQKAIIDNNTQKEYLYFNFSYDETLEKKGNDLSEFLENNKYTIEDIHKALDKLEDKGIILKDGKFKTYAHIYLI